MPGFRYHPGTMLCRESFCLVMAWLLLTRPGNETWAREAPASIFPQLGHCDLVWSVVFSPDGRLIASGGGDGVAKLWDAASGELLRSLEGHSGVLRNLAFSPNSEWVGAAGMGGVGLWKVSTGELRYRLSTNKAYTVGLAFSPDGLTLACANVDHTVRLWNLADGTLSRTLTNHTDMVYAVAYSSDGKLLASGGADRKVLVRDTQGGNVRQVFAHAAPVISLAFSPKGDTLASASWDQTVKIWNARSGSLIRTFNFESQVEWASLSPDGQWLAVARGMAASVWELNSGKLLRDFQGHLARVQSPQFSPNGRLLATASFDRTVKLWDVRTGTLQRTLGFSRPVAPSCQVAFSPDGQIEAGTSLDNALQLWGTRDGRWRNTLSGHAGKISSLAFSHDSRIVTTGGADESIRFWDLQSGTFIRELADQKDWVMSLAVSPDDTMLASAAGRPGVRGPQVSVKLWDARTGTPLRTLSPLEDVTWAVTFSPDGQFLLTAGEAEAIRYWDPKSGELRRSVTNHNGLITTLAFSPDRQTMASGNANGTVLLWDAGTGEPRRTLSGHSDAIQSVAFSPDAGLLASGGRDLSVRLWNATTGRLLRTLHGHSSPVGSVAFHPDGRTLVSCSEDGAIKYWDIDSGGLRFNRVHMPHNEWLAYSPEKLYYSASPQGDEFAAIRFDGKIRPVYPLSYYRRELRHDSDLWDRLAGPPPPVHPKPIRLWWERTEHRTAWVTGMVLVLITGLAAKVLRRYGWNPARRLLRIGPQVYPGPDSRPKPLNEEAVFSSFGKKALPVELHEGMVLLERYEIRRRVGAGGMGEVFAAHDRRNGRDIAIKAMLPGLLANPTARARFLTEARLATKLVHANIITVYSLEQDQGIHFLTMEMALGRTLRQEMQLRKVARQTFTVEEARRLIGEVVAALQYAHQFMVHRDVKPENIWLTSEGGVKLMDFGIAHSLDSAATLTLTGARLGTPYYMAPEQLHEAKNVDPRADQYAVAVVLYELLTGQMIAGMARPLRELRPDVSEGLSAAVSKALGPRPEDRFENMRAFLDAISERIPGVKKE